VNTSAASNAPGSAPSEPAPFRDLSSDATPATWALWCVGVLFAGVITFYWIADEIYPFAI
jgi:hypothetical protein